MPELSDKEERARRRRWLQARAAANEPMAPAPAVDGLPGYAELHCLSNFSFQRGASHPEELVKRAYELGYAALALTDECSVAGIVRAHVGLREHLETLDEEDRASPDKPPRWRNPGFRLLYGSEFDFGRFKLVVLARNLVGWGQLCEFITAARRTEAKGRYRVDRATSDLASLCDCELLFVPRRQPGVAIDSVAVCADLADAAAIFCSKNGDPLGDRLWLAVELFNELDDDLWLAALQQAGAQCGVPLVAAGDVHMHVRSRKALQDVLTAVRAGRPVAECGFALQPNAERHLRPRLRLADLYPPPLLAHTLEVMRRCTFDPDVIREHYHYPKESIGNAESPAQALVRKTWEGALQRYPLERYAGGIPEAVCRQVQHELALIIELDYEMFFLTVEDIVAFARRKKILCQGRGSSANSAVCYCLGITAIDPGTGNLLFERFLSRERREPPDIDVDFEHERREEVIQYIYQKYGRDRAAIAAVVIRYRSRSALRDTGKALGIDEGLVDLFAKDHHWFDRIGSAEDDGRLADSLQRAGVQTSPFKLRQWLELAQSLQGFPRHLSQHVGGFVLTQDRLTQLVPVENAAMKDRSVIQWEKDDLEAMGMLKVDVLALGMLSAIRGALALRNQWRGTAWQMHEVPEPEKAVYDMICDADVVGVFQIESRAQMSMLPRLRPRCYYDLVIEVAIVRPGPIQGGMVHPYLKNREKLRRQEEVHYPYPALKAALGRTLGIPIFQEQVMQIAMIAADFTPDQADRLRRAMAAWKRTGGIDKFHDQLVEGMVANGYDREFAEAIYRQCEGFGDYGFPESHAASFAKLVLVSCWLKFHEPACFLAAMLNAQPMGFYPPSQLVQDARRHGVEVRPVDAMVSELDCTLEAPDPLHIAAQLDSRYAACQGDAGQPAVRLGLRRVAALSKAGMQRLVAARMQAPFTSVEDLALRAELDPRDMAALAQAEALTALAGHRRQQVWEATATRGRGSPALLKGVPIHEPALALPAAPEGEEIVGDYAALGLTLRRHPLALLRPRLDRLRLQSAQALRDVPHGATVRACGIVTVRQRPGTAKGTIFVTLEDETGAVNVIVWRHVVEAWREPLLKSHLLAVQGTWQRDTDSGGKVQHLVAERFHDLTPWLGRLAKGQRSRDFH